MLSGVKVQLERVVFEQVSLIIQTSPASCAGLCVCCQEVAVHSDETGLVPKLM